LGEDHQVAAELQAHREVFDFSVSRRTQLFHRPYPRRNKRHSQIVDVEPDNQPDPGEQPETLAERSLAKRRLVAALRELPEEQRDVFLLHEEAGLNLDQIASVTGANRETAKSRLRYAVRKLRVAIDEPAETS
jgi:RNA polymerase sigma-70 factor (ECF subfamily)